MSQELEDGFYWVRLRKAGAWKIIEKCRGVLWLDGRGVRPMDIHEIDPRPIKREAA